MAKQVGIDSDVSSKKLPDETEKADDSTSTVVYNRRDGRKSFMYRILNKLRDPKFDESICMAIVEDKPLIYYMEKVVDMDGERFKSFTVKYFGGDLRGYFITAVNNVSENYAVNKSYWQIRTNEGRTPVGISHFIPKENMEVTIELVKAKADEKCE